MAHVVLFSRINWSCFRLTKTVEAAKAIGYVCDRLDYQLFDKPILVEMHNRIHRCVGIVADVTGANPNVMYELGYAKAREKPSILISATPPEKLPFDIRGWPIVVYNFGQTNKLQKELIPRFQHIFGKA
jgi:hypothetical protein